MTLLDKDGSSDNPRDVKELMVRLGHFDPSSRDSYGNQVLDYLILDSLAAFGSMLKVTTKEVKDAIRKTYLLEFDEAEISVAGKRLSDKKMLVLFTGERFERPQLQILAATEETINSNIAQTRSLEERVLQAWKEELHIKYKVNPVVEEKMENIVEALQLFASRMFVRHGVECVALLYPEDEKTKRWLNEIGGGIFKDFPKLDSFTDAVVRLEIPLFFKSPDAIRGSYVAHLFNTSFFWHLIQVDDKCSRVLREVTKGQKLFLDNNILYTLLGFDGASVMQSMHNVLKMARVLKYELWVTTKTIDEFHASLGWHVKEFKKKPPVPAELARIALEQLGTDSFLTSYWDYFVKHKLSIEEFVIERSHLEKLLGNLQVETTNKYRKEIENSSELIDEESTLRTACGNQFNDNIIEHDAFHRLFIQRVRKGPKYRFSEAVAWFLTHDTKLPYYDRIARKSDQHLPFCVLTDQWIQINRPLLARTANQRDYEESFHILVTQPFLRTTMSTLSLENVYNQVLGRLARFKSMNPKLALSIVTDKHFMMTMSSETEESKIDAGIEHKLVDLAAELDSQRKSLETDVTAEKKTVDELRTRIEQIESVVTESRSRHKHEVEDLTTELEKERLEKRRLEEELIASRERLESFARSLSDRAKEFEAYRSNVKLWIVASLGFVVASTGLWLNGSWLRWDWFKGHRNKTLIEISFQILLIFVFLNFPLRKHWLTWVAILVALAIAILTLSSQ
jgi:hypothetical protein